MSVVFHRVCNAAPFMNGSWRLLWCLFSHRCLDGAFSWRQGRRRCRVPSGVRTSPLTVWNRTSRFGCWGHMLWQTMIGFSITHKISDLAILGLYESGSQSLSLGQEVAVQKWVQEFPCHGGRYRMDCAAGQPAGKREPRKWGEGASYGN